ncbi:sensor histidine kinase [Anaerocolumna sp. MB42-C2]|uniref:sensor histidine kinase n=1 Tax=Anaerocolumna sp. MB42-C2 TaxID=3070997 RepID=UPI0027E18990|nr:sensor histidine kinase [Anaerocolumna sp. MB42-C2]WMJ89775.1 sensor histidine kinase [Anaerocolumna sp. MB42-C2]
MNIKQRFERIKFQKKILIANLVLFVVPCIILSIILFNSIQGAANQQINESRLVILNQINNNLDDMFDQIVLYSRYFQCNREVNKIVSKTNYKSEYDKLKAKSSVRQFFETSSIVYNSFEYNMQIMCSSGYNYSSTDDRSIDISYPDLHKLEQEPWYTKLKKEDNRIAYISTWKSTEFSAMKNENAIQAICLIKNLNSGRVVGLMNIDLSQKMLDLILKRGLQNKHQQVFLMDDTGKVISSTKEETIGERITSQIYLKKLHDNVYGYFRDKIDGKISQICFVTNGTTGWKLVLYDDGKSALLAGNSLLLFMVMASIAYLLLAMVMTVFNSKYISRPLQKLKKDMKLVYKGDLSVRTEVEAMDEFGELSLQFNKMIGRIEELIGRLEKNKEEQRLLELRALQAQINPHFLYNTLASIRFLVEMGMSEKAEQSLLAFVQLLKRTYSDQRKLVPIKDEIIAIENYLILMQNRYQDMFTWEIQIDPEIEKYGIPKISIQPLVENAILHGFSGNERTGHIRITGYRKDDIIISVIDDGVGGNLEKIHKILESKETEQVSERFNGIGLQNIEQRLKLMFGESYGLSVKTSEWGGIQVDIHIPVVSIEQESN